MATFYVKNTSNCTFILCKWGNKLMLFPVLNKCFLMDLKWKISMICIAVKRPNAVFFILKTMKNIRPAKKIARRVTFMQLKCTYTYTLKIAMQIFTPLNLYSLYTIESIALLVLKLRFWFYYSDDSGTLSFSFVYKMPCTFF